MIARLVRWFARRFARPSPTPSLDGDIGAFI